MECKLKQNKKKKLQTHEKKQQEKKHLPLPTKE